ncbi:helical backbone metal receptor [Planococcus sp. ISL-109]|uniref:ABC transporter substrate-binding protein n=1 Tax=Planococcus sp. ISL-109 TaxID=2819166 RepID=UPI001BE689B0|nr:helical backbone metal receptor [Planococcus sp. ISL-109]MBT2582536.1 ABC transporter substrate-binding protein [Planococcus sp. ISL-109]
MRIISICPSNTELLAFLNADHMLVGVDDYSDWPKSIDHLPRLGPDLSIRMDELEALTPDLVLASLSVPGMEKNVDELVKRNIPHLVLDPQSFADIRNDLQTVAAAIHMDAQPLLTEYDAAIEELGKRGQQASSTPSLYWEWWPKPVFTPGGINWLSEMSRLVGARNCFEDKETANVQTDWEDVRTRDPDYILLAWVGVLTSKVKPELVLKRSGTREMKAAQQIHVMEEALFCRPSPRLLEGAIKLGKLVHPQAFADFPVPAFILEKQLR